MDGNLFTSEKTVAQVLEDGRVIQLAAAGSPIPMKEAEKLGLVDMAGKATKKVGPSTTKEQPGGGNPPSADTMQPGAGPGGTGAPATEQPADTEGMVFVAPQTPQGTPGELSSGGDVVNTLEVGGPGAVAPLTSSTAPVTQPGAVTSTGAAVPQTGSGKSSSSTGPKAAAKKSS